MVHWSFWNAVSIESAAVTVPDPATNPVRSEVRLSLPEKVLKSVEVSNQVAVVDAYGILKVCTPPEELMLNVLPVVPIAKVCELVFCQLSEVIHPHASVAHTAEPPLIVST